MNFEKLNAVKSKLQKMGFVPSPGMAVNPSMMPGMAGMLSPDAASMMSGSPMGGPMPQGMDPNMAMGGQMPPEMMMALLQQGGPPMGAMPPQGQQQASSEPQGNQGAVDDLYSRVTVMENSINEIRKMIGEIKTAVGLSGQANSQNSNSQSGGQEQPDMQQMLQQMGLPNDPQQLQMLQQLGMMALQQGGMGGIPNSGMGLPQGDQNEKQSDLNEMQSIIETLKKLS